MREEKGRDRQRRNRESQRRRYIEREREGGTEGVTEENRKTERDRKRRSSNFL